MGTPITILLAQDFIGLVLAVGLIAWHKRYRVRQKTWELERAIHRWSRS